MASITRTVRSPFTGTEATEVWGKRDNQIIYRCPDTGAVFFDRSNISTDVYESYYPYLAEFDDERNQWELSIRRGKYKSQLASMGKYSPGRRLIDVGAGPGYLCRVAREEGWTVKGVEVSEVAAEHGRRHFQVEYTSLDKIAEASVDAITCHHVLEHVAQPREFLESIRHKLVPGGLVVIHVPHQQPLTFWLRELLSRSLGRDWDTWCSLYADIHISGFTRGSLRNTVECVGFKTHFTRITGMWTRYYDPFFAMDYVRNGAWLALAKKGARHAVESIGIPFGMGDWVVGYFAKRSS